MRINSLDLHGKSSYQSICIRRKSNSMLLGNEKQNILKITLYLVHQVTKI